MKHYGYKVCYRVQGKRKLKLYLVTNEYDGAVWNVRWYESHSPPDRKTGEPLLNVTWQICPVRTLIEYKWLWRGCPF